MREIVFDTETTGLNPAEGDKIVEIGAVELVDHMPTGKEYHQYINPMRSMSEEVVKLHGLTEEFLSDKPVFSEICDDFITFIGEDSSLVAHNASFDMNFLNWELKAVGKPEIAMSRVIDTLPMAKKRFPGSRVNLDELCRRFKVDNSARTVHGALLDAQLLADVYLELLGGHEPDFLMDKKSEQVAEKTETEQTQTIHLERTFHAARNFDIPEDELNNHEAFLDKIKDALWRADQQEEVKNEN